MSIQVYIGHSGQRLTLDPNVHSTVEALRSWVAQHSSIQPRNQILLTPSGKQVRTQTLLTESELFVFDSARLTSDAAIESLDANDGGIDDGYNPGIPPAAAIATQSDLAAWQHLFRVRKSWATAVLEGCEARASQADKSRDEQAIIERSLGVAVASLQDHVKGADKKYAAAEAWADEVIQGQEFGDWEQHLDTLAHVPARPDFAKFLPTAAQSITTLQDYVDVSGTRKAALAGKSLVGNFVAQIETLRDDLTNVTKESEELLRVVDEIKRNSPSLTSSEPAQLLGEIKTVVRKLAGDSETVQTMARTAQSATQAAKMASLHSRNHLPNILDYCAEMNEFVKRTRQKKESAAQIASEHMRTLSGIESSLSAIYSDIKNLEVPEDVQQAFNTVNTMTRLPSVYGQLLVESVRRREWVAKMKRDCSTLQEEVATYQDEEDKRRKKWIRTVDDIIDPDLLYGNVLGIELSLFNEGGSWPMVTRDELQQYLTTLLEVYGRGPVSDEMEQAIKDLDKPTRKQIKHAKAFKNGSMHEAAFGDTSLLLRGDEPHKALRESNIRLEEELKGQKSRVRKLEDLLHRQTQTSRLSSGDIFTPRSGTPPTMPASQFSEDLSRMRHRRLSSAQALEEKKLARRVVDLEAELQVLKDEATSRKSSDAEAQKQVEEAVSIKKDLMENMDAQQREFAEVRRSLERELSDAKERVEELENELERLVGSRDDERHGVDTKIVSLEEEVARLKQEAATHSTRANEAQQASSTLEERLRQTEEGKQKVQAELESFQRLDTEHMQSLLAAHRQLDSEQDPPSSITALSTALEELVRKATIHARDLAEALAMSKSESETLQSANDRLKDDLTSATEKQTELEGQMTSVEEKLAAEQAKSESIAQQRTEEQQQLRNLQNKFAEGETGSEVLRQRIAEEEAKAGSLATELAEAKSHINSMDIELMRLQKKHAAYHTNAELKGERLLQRAERSKELSQRLYSQNGRLIRLLERLGFVVSYQENAMAVERASKMGASTTMTDPNPLSRTVSMTSPSPTRKLSTNDDQMDLSMLRWPDAESAEEEAKQFDMFMQHISHFNLDTFSDAIVKRVRDFEYTARKYNKEAKESTKRADGYKERANRLARETHAKIAVKDFKEGDLALFLPTRGQARGAWAAFNIGCPHYFLAEREGMRLGSRDFIVARIAKIEQKVVDLSKSNVAQHGDGRSIDETSEAPSIEDDNPFDLSDGLTWWMVHATEERGAGAPSTPGLGKSTVAAANVDAAGSIRIKRSGNKDDSASKHLNKSLDSRRSSSTSTKKGAPGAMFSHSPTTDPSRPRSGSQASSRPHPASGLGAASSLDGAQDPAPAPNAAAAPPARAREVEEQPSQQSKVPPASTPVKRSKSPSKSVRSLQRHLTTERPSSPAKSPVRGGGGPRAGQQGVWESIFDFSMESPSK